MPTSLMWLLAGSLLSQSPSPYAGDEEREIKALSPQESADLVAGAGMGMARAAELNGFPGPKHVLELSEALELTPDQERAVRSVFDRMSSRARELGAAVIEGERTLDADFAARTLDAEQLRRATARLAKLRGQLRYTHLAAHLETTVLLQPQQIVEYVRLRGYADHAPAGHQGPHAAH